MRRSQEVVNRRRDGLTKRRPDLMKKGLTKPRPDEEGPDEEGPDEEGAGHLGRWTVRSRDAY
jgi:hypothetical protein